MENSAEARSDLFAPGSRLDRYELICRLAVGGMAEIYLARATGIEGFEKLVVLKRILPQFAHNPGFVSMFLDEARLSATLQHPNIAQVYDIGHCGDSYFFTMEYVRGQDVRSILKTAVAAKRPISLSHIITIVTGAAAGLHAAHEKCDLDGKPLGVVHRDVSPSNVLVGYNGSVKLVDFGVAKAAQRSNQTQTGTLKGKVAYMSPEQCTGRPVDRRSDIFALGILLYELTCRRRLFSGSSEFEIMTKIVQQDVTPPSQWVKNYPAALERILLRALARDPEQRYPTAQAMQLELEEFARKHRLAVSPVKLGELMREMFVDRMREQDAAIARRPTTSEITGESEVESEADIEIEIEAADDPPAVDSEPAGGSVAGPPVAAGRSSQGRWALAAIASIGLIAALVVTQRTGPATADQPATAPTRIADERVDPAPMPAPRTDPAIPAQPPPVATEPPGADTPPAEPTRATARPAESTPTATRSTNRSKSASRAGHTRKRHRRKPAAPVEAPAAAPAPTPTRPSAAEWELDSPLPPPRSSR